VTQSSQPIITVVSSLHTRRHLYRSARGASTDRSIKVICALVGRCHIFTPYSCYWDGTKQGGNTTSLAHAMNGPLHDIAYIGPSPECNVVSDVPNHPSSQVVRIGQRILPFSLRMSWPAIPPETTRLDDVFAYSGSRTTHRIGLRKSRVCDSRTSSPCTITLPTHQPHSPDKKANHRSTLTPSTRQTCPLKGR
jgi:hypothetical protein